MQFDLTNVMTTVDINIRGRVRVNDYGYFANDLDSLYRAVTKEKINLKTIYTRLSYFLEDNCERRFGTPSGNFALFYPTDSKFNEARY